MPGVLDSHLRRTSGRRTSGAGATAAGRAGGSAHGVLQTEQVPRGPVPHSKLYGMCELLYQDRNWLWTFLNVKGVEPTNNASERALRPAVIWRKLSFGTQSRSDEA